MKMQALSQKKNYIIRLAKDEEVFATLTEFCEREGIQSAVFSALGAVRNIKLGFYDLAAKQYDSKEYEDDHEVASMTGNVALVYPEGTRGVDGPSTEPRVSKPLIHMHAVLSGIAPGTENQCVGGHVFAATVAVTLEVHMTVFNEPLTRTLDGDIGLKLLDCPAAY